MHTITLMHTLTKLIDFELQVAVVEIVFRITSAEERRIMADSWFCNTRTAEMFTAIRESEFETVSWLAVKSPLPVLTALTHKR